MTKKTLNTDVPDQDFSRLANFKWERVTWFTASNGVFLWFSRAACEWAAAESRQFDLMQANRIVGG